MSILETNILIIEGLYICFASWCFALLAEMEQRDAMKKSLADVFEFLNSPNEVVASPRGLRMFDKNKVEFWLFSLFCFENPPTARASRWFGVSASYRSPNVH